MKIGVITDCFKKSHEEGIKQASALGLDGVQIYATTGEFSPALSIEKKEEYKKLLKDSGLVVSALCGDMGGYGFEIEKDNLNRIEKTKKIICIFADSFVGLQFFPCFCFRGSIRRLHLRLFRKKCSGTCYLCAG